MDLNTTVDPPFTSPARAFWMLLMELNATIDPPFPPPTPMSGLLVELNATIDPPFTSPTRVFWMSVWQSLVWSSVYRSQGCTPDNDTGDRYEVSRSFQRGSESRAASRKVDSSKNFIVNRWKKKERAGTACPSQPINQHYLSTNTTLIFRFVLTPSSGAHRPCID